jgi:hypothetical protein
MSLSLATIPFSLLFLSPTWFAVERLTAPIAGALMYAYLPSTQLPAAFRKISTVLYLFDRQHRVLGFFPLPQENFWVPGELALDFIKGKLSDHVNCGPCLNFRPS